MDNWGGYGMMYPNPWGNLFSFIIMVIFLMAAAAGVIYILRRTPRSARHGESTQASALELANQRYAKGEISREEYQTIKKDIS